MLVYVPLIIEIRFVKKHFSYNVKLELPLQHQVVAFMGVLEYACYSYGKVDDQVNFISLVSVHMYNKQNEAF